MADTQVDMSSASRWHAIRPWTPRLSLSVREINSVSATFILTSLSPQSNIALLFDSDIDDRLHDISALVASNSSVVSDALSSGLSIKLNGVHWRKVLVRIEDDANEAIIIIYGLLPGRHYDVEIAVIPGQEKMKGQFTTDSSGKDLSREGLESPQDISSRSNQLASQAPADASPSPPTPATPVTPSTPSHSTQKFEEYLSSLKVKLSRLQEENEDLSSSLKAARRDAQKSQSALRSEISSLKRATQKHTAGDVRMRQKVRALEEAVKQAAKSREEAEAELKGVEESRKAQEAELMVLEQRWATMSEQAEARQKKKLEEEEEAARRVRSLKVELASLESKLRRLKNKKEKLEGRGEEAEELEASDDASDGTSEEGAEPDATKGGIIGSLETKLREVTLERERIETDPYAYLAELGDQEDDRGKDMVPGEHLEHTQSAFRASNSGSHHPRNAHHYHHHNVLVPHHPRGGKRHTVFAPVQSTHPHGHAHSHSYVQPRPFHPQHTAAVRPALPVQRSFVQLHSSAHFPPKGNAQAGTLGRNHSTRRKSSPPPPVAPPSSSTLSSLAPPFEPSSQARVAGGPWQQ